MNNWGGWDTETQDGKAVLVCTDRAALTFPRTFDDIASFLLADGRPNLAAYNLAYDSRAIIWFLERETISLLNRETECAAGPYRLAYIPKKMLEIVQGDRRVRLWDCFHFYGGSLDETAAKILGERKTPIPRSWLTRMGSVLRSRFASRVRDYCQRDADLARRLMLHIKDKAERIGAWASKPYSPAALARKYFQKEFPEPPDPWTQTVFRNSYYGGRTEIYQRGRVGATWHYDIHSAYPAAYCGMPDPSTGKIVRVKKGAAPHPETLYGAYRIRAVVDPEVHIPLFPYRLKNLLIYPCGEFETWTDARTLKEAPFYKGHDFEILEGIEIRRQKKDRPLFTDAAELFKKRETEPELKIVYKLVLNSLYGVLASIIEKWFPTEELIPGQDYLEENGKHYVRRDVPTRRTHFALAAHITAATRLQLAAAMNTDPAAIVSCATDGIVSTRPLKIKTGRRLGEWGNPETFDSGSVIASGIGFYRRGRTYKEVSRGIHADFSILDMLQSPAAARSSRVSYSQTTVDGIGQMLRSQRPELFNVIRKMKKNLDVNADVKRVWPGPWTRAREVLTKCQTSESRIIL